MAYAKFPVEVLTPDGEVLSEEVEMVSTHTTLGSIGLLANHEPLLATLEPAELRIHRSESEIVRYAQAEGYLQFADNRARLLLDEAIPVGELDRASLQERLSHVRADAQQAPEDSEARASALREARRLEVFLSIPE
jgi:F-type H+-transporting ATPase subunit epsilon